MTNNLFRRLFGLSSEHRNLVDQIEERGISIYSDEAADIVGTRTKSGVRVSPESSLKLSAVYSAIKSYTNDFISLPRTIIEKSGDERREAIEHDQYYLFKYSCSPIHSTSKLFETCGFNYLAHGNGYAKLVRDPFSGRPIRWNLKHPDDIVPYIFDEDTESPFVMYKDNSKAGKGKFVDALDMLHFSDMSEEGVLGKSRIRLHAEALGLYVSARDYGSEFFNGGGIRSKAVLEPNGDKPRTMSTANRRLLRKTFGRVLGNKDNIVGIVPDGFSLKELKQNIPNTDAQLLELMKFNKEVVSEIFNIPLHRINGLDRSTNNNIEQQAKEWVMHSLLPFVKVFEDELNRKIFEISSAGRYKVHFNLKGMLRGTIKDQSEYNKAMFDRGIYNADEIRALDDVNPKPDGSGKTYYIPVNLMPEDKISDWIDSKTGKNGK